VLGLDAFKFDSNLLTRDDIGTKVNITETATADLPADAIFVTNAKILEGHISFTSAMRCCARNVLREENGVLFAWRGLDSLRCGKRPTSSAVEAPRGAG
jgi:hypothetical protein